MNRHVPANVDPHSAPRPVRFAIAVCLGVITEIAVDTLKALAHSAHEGNLAHDLRPLPLLALTIISLGGFIAVVLFIPEKFIDSRRERVMFPVAFILAVILSGYFFHVPYTRSSGWLLPEMGCRCGSFSAPSVDRATNLCVTSLPSMC